MSRLFSSTFTGNAERRLWRQLAVPALAMLLTAPVYALPNAYIPSINAGNSQAMLTVIDTASDTEIGGSPVAFGTTDALAGAVVSADGSRVYVANQGAGTIEVISGTSKQTPITLPAGAFPESLALHGTALYVTDQWNDAVYKIDTATSAVTTIALTGKQPYGIAVSPDGATVYTTNMADGTVSIIDTATAAVTTSVGPYAAAGGKGDIRTLDGPSGPRVYVAYNDPSGAASAIYVLLPNGTLDTSMALPAGAMPLGLAVGGDNTKVYVTGANGANGAVWVIDAASNTLASSPVFAGQAGATYETAAVAVSGGSDISLYATAPTNNYVDVFNLGTGALKKTIAGSASGNFLSPGGLGYGRFISPGPAGTPLRLVTVTKTLTGDTTLYTSGTFDVTVTCSTVNQTFQFTPGATMSGTMLVPQGETCTVSENTGNAVVNGTSRKTIAPNKFAVGPSGQAVAVENELLTGSVTLATVEVTKKIAGLTVGHDPAAVFGITVKCDGTSLLVKTLNLAGEQSGITDALVGDTCTIAEPTIPAAKATYEYVSSIYPEMLAVTPGGRVATVVNTVIRTGAATHQVTFAMAAVTDLPGSGYQSGALFNMTVICDSGNQLLSLAAGDQAIVHIENGTTCSAITAGSLPALNASFHFEPPTTTPGLPHAILGTETITIHYRIAKSSEEATVPIPALDAKALLLLIGLLSGAVFWQRRRRS